MKRGGPMPPSFLRVTWRPFWVWQGRASNTSFILRASGPRQKKWVSSALSTPWPWGHRGKPALESPGESDHSLSPNPHPPAPCHVLSNRALTVPLCAALELPPQSPGLLPASLIVHQSRLVSGVRASWWTSLSKFENPVDLMPEALEGRDPVTLAACAHLSAGFSYHVGWLAFHWSLSPEVTEIWGRYPKL